LSVATPESTPVTSTEIANREQSRSNASFLLDRMQQDEFGWVFTDDRDTVAVSCDERWQREHRNGFAMHDHSCPTHSRSRKSRSHAYRRRPSIGHPFRTILLVLVLSRKALRLTNRRSLESMRILAGSPFWHE
jgi:hypothetical protein